MKFPVFDLHCDTAKDLIGPAGADHSKLKKNQVHIDLERAGQLPGYAQCFACFTTTGTKIDPVDYFEKKKVAVLKEIDKNRNAIRQAFSADEIERNREAGIMSAILTIEGPAGFGFDPARLEDLYKIGFRMSSLGWNEQNPLTGSHVTGGGLTDLGRVYLKEMQRLGMIVDVSHISDQGFWDIIDISEAPVVATHSNSRNVHPVTRNVTDDMFRAICASGGVVGINLYPDFLGEKANLDTVCDHIFHLLEIDTDCRHISLGADLDGIDCLPEGFAGVQDYPKLSDRLLERGLREDMVYRIFWSNAIEVFRKCCM